MQQPMKNYFAVNEWSVVEEGFDPSWHEASESIFSLGNGHMGHRANFEERYSGESLQGTYIAGIYYPDKTRVGWWKNGYPEYFAKVPNAPFWIAIHVKIDGEELDLHHCNVSDFVRELNMQHGYLERSFTAAMPGGKQVKVTARRFLSMARDEIGAIRYTVQPLNFNGHVEFFSHIDGDVRNKDANYDEKFWEVTATGAVPSHAFVHARTRKSGFEACFTMKTRLLINGVEAGIAHMPVSDPLRAGHRLDCSLLAGDTATLYKYVSVADSLNYTPENLQEAGLKSVSHAYQVQFDNLFEEHRLVWEEKWTRSDIRIDGDAAAQQGIRFNIFHLNQTYTGRDDRLNIGPKGFTGEKYGGSTYWDTEAFLINFYLSTEPRQVARNLLIYRYKQLEKAIENGAKLGFTNGAALYPMVTMNGEECHNEWEITFEEIHRNGAIAYAIYNYVRYTGDTAYLWEYGLEVLIALSRFWRQRVNWSGDKRKYVILGVTGPNEYENNVNNNWYTNTLAAWTLQYTLEVMDLTGAAVPERLSEILRKTRFDVEKERKAWQEIVGNMYFPVLENGVFLQQDGYMDKDQKLVSDLTPEERPINQHWSWDRILRSVYIKQADVLQGMFFFEDRYTTEEIRRNFAFYEPRTVHESSLSPCVHSILANRIGEEDKAYALYLRTSRLDLDDYNKEVDEGLHITSMGGTWMSVVMGFGGMRVKDDLLSFSPALPKNWARLSFHIMFRERTLRVDMESGHAEVVLVQGDPLEIEVNGNRILCA
jgi:maltose phosphorylase